MLRKSLLLVVSFFLLIAFVGCNIIISPPSTQGALTISIGNGVSRTLLPSLSMEPVQYIVTGSGPEGAGFDETISGTSLTIESLAFGEWDITVTAYNDEGTPIGAGSGTVAVHANDASHLSITVTPYDGFGSLTLDLSWTDGEVDIPQVEASLLPSEGAARDLAFIIDGASASFSADDVSAGYHTLILKLLDNGALTMGAVETVRIVADNLTEGNFVFDQINQASGSLEVEITPDMADPLEVSISGAEETKPENESLILTASVSNGSGNITYVWYVNGDAVDTGEIFDFDSSYAQGYYRIDVTAFNSDASRAGSASSFIEVIEAEENTESIEIVAKLIADDTDHGDVFGHSVSISGDTVVMGAPGNDDGDYAGSAYIFARSGSSWVQSTELVSDDAGPAAYFGESVSISGDTIIVGAYLDWNGGNRSGSAYIFTLSDDSWIQSARLIADDAGFEDYFGQSVSISGDTAIVGAYGDDDGGVYSGSAYIFTLTGDSWIQSAKLTPDDPTSDAYFGLSVSIYGDTAIVGAIGVDDNSGSAYVFTRSGEDWIQSAILTADDATSDDCFGRSVSISGNTAIVGADGDDDGGSSSGSAYIYTYTEDSWVQTAKLTADDAAADDYFGQSVSISGNNAIVGAYADDDAGFSSGSAYIFSLSGDSWIQSGKLTPDDADVHDRFGYSVSISGNLAIVGADYDIPGGSAYVAVYE